MAVALVAAVGGYAWFANTAVANSNPANVGSLTAATISAPASATTNVAITWTSQATLADPGPNSSITYTVERKTTGSFAPIASGPCAGSLPHGTTSCVDSPTSSDTYTYRVVAYFNSWTATSNTQTVVFNADTTQPTSTISFPSASYYNAGGWIAGCSTPAVGDICGTANDPGVGATGVQKVELSIQRSSDGDYWNGGAWVSGIQWNLAGGMTSWTYPLAASALADGVQYTLQSRATDNAGNVQSPVATAAFTYDTTAPSPTVVLPANNSYTNQTAPSISGTAGTQAADVAHSADSGTVTVKIYSGATTGGTLVQTIPNVPVTGGGIWLTTPLPALTANAQYTVQATQTDAVGNTGTSNANTFVIDTGAPAPTVSAPATTTVTPTISGTAGTQAADASHSADSSTVTVKIFAGTGTGGTLLQMFDNVAVTGGGTWSVAAATLSNGSTYTAQVVQGDGAGNSGSNTTTWAVDTGGTLGQIGAATCRTNNANNALVDYPAGTTAGDLLLFVVANGATQNSDFGAAGNSNGWNPVSSTWPSQSPGGGVQQELQAFYGFAHAGASGTAQVTNASANVTSAALFTGSPDYTGDTISGSGIPAGAYIQSVNTSTHVATLSAKATTTATETVAITPKVNVRFLTNANGACGWVADYKVASTETLNGATKFGTQATGSSLTPATFNTANSNPSIVISIAEIATTSAGTPVAPTLGTANGFTSRFTVTSKPSNGIGFSIADRNVAATGAVTSPVWTEPASSQWAYLTFAFS